MPLNGISEVPRLNKLHFICVKMSNLKLSLESLSFLPFDCFITLLLLYLIIASIIIKYHIVGCFSVSDYLLGCL